MFGGVRLNNDSLIELIQREKFDEVRERLAQGEKFPPELQDWNRSTIFERTIRAKAFDLIDVFIKDGLIETDIYEYDNFERSFFDYLFRSIGDTDEDLAFLQKLLPKLDNMYDAVKDQTLLWLAFKNSASLSVIKLLVDAGFSLNYKNNAEEDYLYRVVDEYNIKEHIGAAYINYLVQEGLDPNSGNIVKKTPLAVALQRNNSYLETLLQNGADPNQPGERNETAYFTVLVHLRCDMETYNLLKQYAPADFDIRSTNDDNILLGHVRMFRSTRPEDLEILTAMINDGADVYQYNMYYDQQKTALDWIAEFAMEGLQAVFETGVIDLDHRDDKGNTLLHYVCGINVNYEQEVAKEIYRKVKLLIEKGADVNATNDLDQTPMMLAATDNLKVKTVELLLKNNAR